MNGPLSGIRVVDLTSVVSGPVAALVLADQGADVIKVESLSGDNTRRGRASSGDLPAMFVSCNRGKRSIALDLKHDAGKSVLWRLIDSSDVLIQNFRPGTTERLGFGANRVLERNKRLIYLSISGVGASGPYAKKRIYDPMIQSLSGMADIQADPTTGRPRMTRTIVVDKTTGMYAAQAVTAALFHRERTGEGQHIELSMLDAMVNFLWPEGMAPFAVVSDETHDAPNSVHDMIFEAQDGYLTVGANSDKEWAALCQGLNQPQWLADPRFRSPALRSQNRQARLTLLEEVLRGETVAHWLGVLDAADVPCAPVLPRREVASHPQVVANNTVQVIDQPGVGAMRQARPAPRFARTPAAIAGPAPFLGEHTKTVMLELGYSDEEVEALNRSKVVKLHTP